MEKSKGSKSGSLVFVMGRNDRCIVHFMTVYQDGLIVDAEFTKPAVPGDKEWELGEKGSIKMIVSEQGAWQEIMMNYSLPDGYINVTAVTALYLTKPILSSIASQFFIRKGNKLQYLSTQSIRKDRSLKKERVLTIQIPAP